MNADERRFDMSLLFHNVRNEPAQPDKNKSSFPVFICVHRRSSAVQTGFN